MIKSVVSEEKKFKHSPWAGADKQLGPNFWRQQEGLIILVICCKFKKRSLQPLTLYTSFHDLINVYSPRSGADNPRGQTFYVNRSLLSLGSFATSFKNNLLEVWFYTFFFHDFIHVYSPRAGVDNPLGRNFDVSRNLLSLRSFCCKFQKNLFEVWFYTFFFFMI